jgi:branched-chain amino acid transport system substrate-binding protein
MSKAMVRSRLGKLVTVGVGVCVVSLTTVLTAVAPAGPAGAASQQSVITIGSIQSLTGPLATGAPSTVPLMQAWVKNINSAGGINGHKIKLIVKDDADSATTAAQDLNELKADHVVALVDEASLVDVDWAAAAAKDDIPVIGGNSVQVGYDISPDFFASSTGLFAAVYGDMVLAKEYGTKLAILPCTESATCTQSVAIYKAFGADVGVSVVYSQSIAASTPDFTSVCLALKDSGAESYVIVDSTAVIQRVSNTCVQQGVTAKLIESSGAVDPSLLKVPGAQGLLASDVDFPFLTDNTPATQEFHAIVNKDTPQLKNQPETNEVWTGLQLFGAALQGVGKGAVTSDSLKQALYALKPGDTLGGLAPPLTFTSGKVNTSYCWFVLGISHNKFVAPQGGKPSCAPEAQINAIFDAFLKAEGINN